jgi:hypothetical protein
MSIAGFRLSRSTVVTFEMPRDVAALPPSVSSKVRHGESSLKAIREWRGLSQVDLADRTGIAITQIQRAERGSDIPGEAMRLLARGLRVSEELLLN